MEKKEEERQYKEKYNAHEKTTAAAKATYKELNDKDSRRITTTMERKKKKSMSEVQHPPEILPQLDGGKDGNENEEGDHEEGMTEEEKQSCQKIMEMMKQAKSERVELNMLLSS